MHPPWSEWKSKRFPWFYLALAAAVFFYYRHFIPKDIGSTVAFAALIGSFAIYLMFRHTRYLPIAATAATIIITIYCLIADANHHQQADLPAWLMLGFLAGMPRSLLSYLLAIYTGAVILYVNFTTPFPFAALFGVVGLYLAISTRRIRREATELDKRRLEELDRAYSDLTHAHEELQEAQIDSMRYAALAERASIARDIHDGLGHHLTSLIVQLQAIDLMLQNGKSEEAGHHVRDALDLSREGMKEVRRAVREWSEDESLLGLAALKGLLSRTEARSKLRCEWIQEEALSDWPLNVSVVLYRVLQESLTNVLKHANAESVTVRIREKNSQIVMTVSDDGTSLPSDPPQPGFGMTGMLQRCRQAGGDCEFRPNATGGLTVQATLPLIAPSNPEDEKGDPQSP